MNIHGVCVSRDRRSGGRLCSDVGAHRRRRRQAPVPGQVTTPADPCIWVRSRPGPTALYWVVDANGTTVSSGDTLNDYWTLVRVSEYRREMVTTTCTE